MTFRLLEQLGGTKCLSPRLGEGGHTLEVKIKCSICTNFIIRCMIPKFRGKFQARDKSLGAISI